MMHAPPTTVERIATVLGPLYQPHNTTNWRQVPETAPKPSASLMGLLWRVGAGEESVSAEMTNVGIQMSK